MSISIRRAGINDTEAVMKLLSEVLELHAALRPDIFISGSTKYTAKELGTIFEDDGRPVFVAEDENGDILGYVFCVMQRQPFSTNMKDFTTLYIDDLCVDENSRGQHVGLSLIHI